MKRNQVSRMTPIGWVLGGFLWSLLPGAGLADDGPIVCIDLQTSTTPDPGTITSTYTGSGPTVYAFLVVTEVPGDRVSGVSVGFNLSTDGSVTNTGFTMLEEWEASSENAYGFDPEPEGSGESVPTAIGFWTLELSEGSSSIGTLSLVPPGGVNGESILVIDDQRRGFAPAEARHAGINVSAPTTTLGDPLYEFLSVRQHHVLMQSLGQNLVMPDGLVGAPLETFVAMDSTLYATLEEYGPVRIDKVFPDISAAEDSLAYTWEGATIRLPKLWKIFKVSLADTTLPEFLVDDLAAAGRTSFAECNALGEPALEPDDDLYPDQWHLENDGSGDCPDVFPPASCTADADVDASAAWDITTGSPEIILAIIDSGIYPDHEDFAGRTIIGDTDWGCDCYPNQPSHGTRVAGVAAATTDNELGVAGMDWQCTLMSQCTNFTEDVFARAITDATDQGADVINTSVHFHGDDPDCLGFECLRQAVLYAFLRGTVPVSANGNLLNNNPRYPAAWAPIVLAVGNTKCCDKLSGTFHDGWLDIVAPGTAIWTMDSGLDDAGDCASQPDPSAYEQANGSSFSSPLAAGLTSLILALDPYLRDIDAHRIIELTAIDLAPGGDRYDDDFGWGRLNAQNALEYVRDNTIYSVIVDADQVDQVGSPSEWIEIQWDHPPDPYPAGVYLSRRYEMQAQDIVYPFDFTATPDIWVRVGGTIGLNADDYQQYDFPWGEVVSASATDCDLRTYVYEVDTGAPENAWWPATREEARFVYTVAGTASSPASVDSKVETNMTVSVRRTGDGVNFVLDAPRTGTGRLALYDAAGRMVRVLHDGAIESGSKIVTWDQRNSEGSLVSSGVYFAEWTIEGLGSANARVVIVR